MDLLLPLDLEPHQLALLQPLMVYSSQLRHLKLAVLPSLLPLDPCHPQAEALQLSQQPQIRRLKVLLVLKITHSSRLSVVLNRVLFLTEQTL